MVRIIATIQEAAEIIRACEKATCCAECALDPVCNGTKALADLLIIIPRVVTEPVGVD